MIFKTMAAIVCSTFFYLEVKSINTLNIEMYKIKYFILKYFICSKYKLLYSISLKTKGDVVIFRNSFVKFK